MIDAFAMARWGLLGVGEETAPVPLTGVTVDAEIHNFCAKVVITQHYSNREPTPIEATYVFPLDERSAVCGFEAVVDDTGVVGEIHEREKAFELYDDAMEQGHGAYLLDEQRPDVFQTSIGNLPPGKDILVRLTYVTELTTDDGRVRFTIPTTVSPRYAPTEDRIGVGRSEAEALNPPRAWDVPYGLTLSARLTMPGRITGIECPSHPISLTLNECEGTVLLGQPDAPLDRDFVLTVTAEGLDAPHALIERGNDGSEVIAVSFAPTFSVAQQPAEIIFLVDRSGSMQGQSIEEVRKALQLCLRSMVAGCRFNVVGFGSTHEMLFAESRAYDQTSMAAASEYVGAMDADLGGTEILPALHNVLESPTVPELPRHIVVLTDGEVTNTDAVIALARKHSAGARIFTFGIGAGASHHLVRGLARAGRGSAEFMHPGERIEPKVLRQFARLLSPALTDVRVEWTGGTVRQAPVTLPPVFAGGCLLVYGLVEGTRPTAARLTANGPSGPLAFDVALDGSAAAVSRTAGPLAARARIRELEEGDAWATTRGSLQKERKAVSVRAEIIRLSLQYGIISRETSFVAIERRETPVHGDIQLHKVPIALTMGWGGVYSGDRPFRSVHPTAPVESWHQLHASSVFIEPNAMLDAIGHYAEKRAPEEFWRPPMVVESVEIAPALMHALILLQRADGTWELDSEIAAILKCELADMKAGLRDAQGSADDTRRAWATALALAWLQLNAAGAENEWRLLAEKGRRWLEDVQAVPPDGATWVDAARTFLVVAAGQ